MDKRLQLREIMTPVPYRVGPEDPISVARQKLSEHNVRHLPVCEGDRVLGVVTERDVAIAASLAQHVVEEESLRVSDFCSGEPYTVDVEERFDKVLTFMGVNRIGSAMVTESGELVGIITTTDVCRVCGQFFQDMFDEVG